MRSNAIEIRPSSGAVGAEISGVDLSEPLAPTACDTIKRTLADRGVVFFRDQTLTPEQHIAAARQFGAININRFFTPADGYPEIALVAKEPEQTTNIGGGWHTDHRYDQAPALGSMLYARQVPHAVFQHVCRLRRLIRWPEANVGRTSRGAFQSARVWRKAGRSVS